MKVDPGRISTMIASGLMSKLRSPGLSDLQCCDFFTNHRVQKSFSGQTFGTITSKLFIASCLAEVLALVSGSSKNERIQQLDERLKIWAKRKGNKMPHSGSFCSERIGLTSYQVQPDASWSKHDDTRVYHKFLEDWMTSIEENIRSDSFFCRILWGVRSINRMFSILYKAGCGWLKQKL